MSVFKPCDLRRLPPKGLPLDHDATADLTARRYNVADGDLPLPLATLSRSALTHNIAVMSRWCRDHGALLAPHGKTTLAPELFRRQLAAGAWGITVTTGRHAALAVAAGAQRLIVASQLVDPVDLRSLATLAAEKDLEVYVFVDSEAGLRRLCVAAETTPGRIHGLVELGLAGGRTGVRDETSLFALLDRLGQASVGVAGISAFEGILPIPRPRLRESTDSGQEIHAFLERAASMIAGAMDRGLITPDAIISAGGSKAFDLVVDYLSPLGGKLILRSGCYVTHDHGTYAQQSPLQEGNVAGINSSNALRAALQVWAHVISTPEPSAAVVSFGRRDAGHDVDLPIPLKRVRGHGAKESVDGWKVTAIWDQHARLEAEPFATGLEVGDVLTFGISHPCTTFDKWRTLVEIDDDDTVVDLVETWF